MNNYERRLREGGFYRCAIYIDHAVWEMWGVPVYRSPAPERLQTKWEMLEAAFPPIEPEEKP